MNLEITVDVDIVDLVPDVEQAVASELDARLRKAAPRLRAAAEEWLQNHFPEKIGFFRPDAVIVWIDPDGLHVGVDTRRLHFSNDMPGFHRLPHGKVRLATLRHTGPKSHSYTEQLRDVRSENIRTRREESEGARWYYKPGLWLAHNIESFQEAVSIGLEECLYDVFSAE